MLRKNQKEEMPFAYYLAKYAGLDPAEVTARLGGDITFDGAGFRLSFLGRPYRLAWPDYAIESPDAAALALRKPAPYTLSAAWTGIPLASFYWPKTPTPMPCCASRCRRGCCKRLTTPPSGADRSVMLG